MDFDSYFGEIYGGRWPALKRALQTEPNKVVLNNPFGGAYEDYSLDAASLMPVRALDVGRGERVADFCSAPGGKLLAMVFGLAPSVLEAEWLAADLSPSRVGRLKAILHDCLPPEVLSRIRVRRADSSLLGQRHPGTFDKILVDAPCSGERHLLASKAELDRWSVKGVKRLTVRQHSLLCAALDALKPGGRLVYSTCSISPAENDGVIKRLGESRADLFRVLNFETAEFPASEATEFGRIVLPDRANCGPIYASLIMKN